MSKITKRLVVDIDPEIKKKFRIRAYTEGKTMREKVLAMIDLYLSSPEVTQLQ